MTPTLWLIAASLASYSGFACLALAMPRHGAAARGQKTGVMLHRRRLRACGFLMLGIAYALCVYCDGPGFGSLLWVVLISEAAVAVALTLAWHPQLLISPARYLRFRAGGRA